MTMIMMATPSIKTPRSANSSAKKPTWDDVVDVSTPAASNVFTRLSSNTTPSSSGKLGSGTGTGTSTGGSSSSTKESASKSQELHVPEVQADIVSDIQETHGNDTEVSGVHDTGTGTGLKSVEPPSSPTTTSPTTTILRFTDEWKTIQCAVALKQLYERFEDHPGKPDVTKRLYMAAMKALCVAHTTTNTNNTEPTELEIKSIAALNTTKASFRLVMPAALQKRTKELAVYGNDLIIMVLERIDQIIPL